MGNVEFAGLQPILGTRDVERAISFYTEQLGFELMFRDGSTPTNYLGLRRGLVNLHMQFQYENEIQTTRLRFEVSDPDALLMEFEAKGVAIQTAVRNAPWGTREFALFDPDRNALMFYRFLRREELSAQAI